MVDRETEENNSLKDSGLGIGAGADGHVEVFPLSELNARIAQRDADEKMSVDELRAKIEEDRDFEIDALEAAASEDFDPEGESGEE